jgi:hypothetical protein
MANGLDLFMEHYIHSASSSILLSQIYLGYRSFCITIGAYPLLKKHFKEALEARNVIFQRKNNGVACYLELREK